MNDSTLRVALAVAPLLLAACGGGNSGAPAEAPSHTTPRASSNESAGEPSTNDHEESGAAASSASDELPDAETAEEIFQRVRPDLVACYEKGKKAVPTMTSGKITLNAEIDRDGKATCVVPSDDTGLTQEVEDCMRLRVGRETFKSNGGTWSAELPIVAKGGKLTLGPPADAAPTIESIETHGLPDSAQEVVESLMPKLRQCTEGVTAGPQLRVVHVGARVGKDGRVECALATSPSPVPAKLRECTESVMESAKFAPPRSSVGLVSVPMRVFARRR